MAECQALRASQIGLHPHLHSGLQEEETSCSGEMEHEARAIWSRSRAFSCLWGRGRGCQGTATETLSQRVGILSPQARACQALSAAVPPPPAVRSQQVEMVEALAQPGEHPWQKEQRRAHPVLPAQLLPVAWFHFRFHGGSTFACGCHPDAEWEDYAAI